MKMKQISDRLIELIKGKKSQSNSELDSQLSELIKQAARKAILKLFDEHKENFYYCSLITDGEGHCPVISAWSEEALEELLSQEEDAKAARLDYKWSYADSPYYAYGETFFAEVEKVFDERMDGLESDDEIEEEINLRLSCMERAMADLDREGLFGTGKKRNHIVINAEIMPPDYTNTERGIRLNPKEALTEWLDEIAEEDA